MTTPHMLRRKGVALAVSLICAAVLLFSLALSLHAQQGGYKPGQGFEIYFVIGDSAAWMGNQIRYTVYSPSVVEARLLSGSGEIISIFRLGEQAPGQYTLPWDGTYEGSPFAGYYTFELYFGDEYAAKFPMVVGPAPK